MPVTRSTTNLSTEAARAARRWYVADADGKVLGRLASRIASVLRGKTNPRFSPHVDAGDFVVVVNAAKIRLTGQKLAKKESIPHSSWPAGARRARADEVLGSRARPSPGCCPGVAADAGSRPSSRSTQAPIIRTARRSRCRSRSENESRA